jgi:hypothetical protein
MWKSIIRSSLGTTAYPYCLYIRSLDLRNLAELLDDQLFREVALDTFFDHDMAKFLKAQETPIKKKKGGKASYLNIPLVLDLVGESITKFVSEAASRNRNAVALEDLAGNIGPMALPRWTGRLSRLKSMTLWDGAALSESVAMAIAEKCPSFEDLTFCFCMRDDMDHDLATFFSTLRKNSLQSLAALSAHSVGPETLLALNHHSQSLKILKLDGLKLDTIRHVPLLQGCGSVEVLDLQGASEAEGLINLEATENDVFLQIVAYLCQCDRLRELVFTKFAGAPHILMHVCLRNNIRLRKLHVSGYALVSHQDFHKAISHQTALESLELRADPEGASRDDIDSLVSSVCQLTKLTYLNLFSTSDYFQTSEIQQLVSKLPNLEDFSFTGYDVTDNVWPAISGLHYLRTLNVHAVSSFSLDGLLDYISTLQESNQGLLLSVMNQNRDHNLSDPELEIIRESISAKVDGKFDFVLFREGQESEFDSASD